MTLLAIDPGTRKCGLAVLDGHGELLAHAVVSTETLIETLGTLVAAHHPTLLLLGNGTAMKRVRGAIVSSGVAQGFPLQVVDERHTTELARERYFRDHPPRGLWRLVPRGLQVPHEPYDDYAAIVLAESYLRHAQV